MSQAVVHDLKAVDVDEEHGKFVIVVSLRARNGSLQAVQEQGAIRQIGEGIVKGIVYQFLLRLLEFRNVFEDSKHTYLAAYINDLGGLKANALFAGLRIERNLEFSHATVFGQCIQKAGS